MSNAKNILIVGASSAIAAEVARLYALQKCSLTLVGRNVEKLAAAETDLFARGAKEVTYHVADLADRQAIEILSSRLFDADTKKFDIILIAYGTLGNQAEAQKDSEKLAEIMNVNFVSALIWSEKSAYHLEKNGGQGCLAVVGSVAGDRGRKSNYVYGAAKAGLHTALAGLRHRYAGTSVSILTVKSGFVDTPMTDGMDKSGPLWTGPEKVAQDIVTAIAAGRSILYTPWFWRYIMLIIKFLPSPIFNRLNL